MKWLQILKFALLLLCCTLGSMSWAKPVPVIIDKGHELSKKELTEALRFIPPNMLETSFKDESARTEMTVQILVNKKIADVANKITEEENPEFYWKKVFFIQKGLKELFLKDYEKTLQTPDMTALAREKYLVNKEKYAKVPEKRGSSHILFKCLPGVCDRKALRPKAEKVLEELKSGADFAKMVDKYSDDENSKKKGGKVGIYYRGQPRVTHRYITGLFAIKKVGDYSDIVESRFGFHIIRLDSIEEKRYKSFDEIKPELTEALKKKYRKLAMQSFLQSFDLTPEAKIDYDLINNIFIKEEADLKKEKEEKLKAEKERNKGKRMFK